MKRRFWITLFLFVAIVVGWILYVPYRPERLSRVIPLSADYVSVHERPGARWGGMIRNPLVQSLLASVTGQHAELDPDDPDTRLWVEKLAARQVIAAHLPGGAGSGEDAWVVVSWLGGASQRLRWMLQWAETDEIERYGTYRGRVLYKATSDTAGTREDTACFTLTEGMLIACVSRSEETLIRVLDTYDRRHGFGSNDLWPWDAAPDAADRGWVRTEDGERIPFAFDRFVEHGLRGIVRLPTELPPARSELSPSYDQLSHALGDNLLAVLEVRRETLNKFTREMNWDRDTRIALERAAAALQTDRAVLCVLSRDYSFRFKGLKWPGLLLAVPRPPEGEAPRQVTAALDVFNSAYKWGVIPGPREVAGGFPLYPVQGTAETAYAKLSVSDQVGIAVLDNWLLVGADMALMRHLLSDTYEATSREPRWLPAFREGEQSAARGWLDLRDGAKAFRIAVTAYALKLLFEDPDGSQDVRQRLNEAKAWIDTVAPLGTCSFRVDTISQQPWLRFAAGELEEGGNE